LFKLDFRYGYLRRKYDGCKYSLKSLETILYELSVTAAAQGRDDAQPSKKRAKLEGVSPGLPNELLESPEVSKELEGIQNRIKHRDELREKLITRCRDGQKAAKQAIFALHRADHGRAYRLIKECEHCIRKYLLPIVEEEPPLRAGSFGVVMEEYVEAKLFYTWLNGKEDIFDAATSKGLILKMEHFEIELKPVEYLGGLCDMTREIGRHAIKCGADRDLEGVKLCLEANSSISIAIDLMDRYPSSIEKKVGFLQRSVETLERMTYEMSLAESAGGLKVSTANLLPAGPASAAALLADFGPSAAALLADAGPTVPTSAAVALLAILGPTLPASAVAELAADNVSMEDASDLLLDAIANPNLLVLEDNH
jgi:predicted translin family RNA/ssDNA-binding protein